MLIKKKQDYDIYDRVEDVLAETEECQKFINQLEKNIKKEAKDRWDPDSSWNTGETFLTAEKDFLMF